MSCSVSEEAIQRWKFWMMLEHGADILLDQIVGRYISRADRFVYDKLYFGCGYDKKIFRNKYADWDLTDLRDNPNWINWDTLLGFPYEEGVLKRVKTKLSLGMFTKPQVEFIFLELARCLKEGGLLDVTFRDFDKLLDRRNELSHKLFVRYIYGSGLYYGSRRKSCWTEEGVRDLALSCGFVEATRVAIIPHTSRPTDPSISHQGMNTRMYFIRTKDSVRKFKYEPKVNFDNDGRMINNGGDWSFNHHIK